MGLFSSLFGYAAKREFYSMMKEHDKEKARNKYFREKEIEYEKDKVLKRQVIAGNEYHNKILIIDNLIRDGVLGEDVEQGIQATISEINRIITDDDRKRIQEKYWFHKINSEQIDKILNEINIDTSKYIGTSKAEPNKYTTLTFMLNDTEYVKKYNQFFNDKGFKFSVYSAEFWMPNGVDIHIGKKL